MISELKMTQCQSSSVSQVEDLKSTMDGACRQISQQIREFQGTLCVDIQNISRKIDDSQKVLDILKRLPESRVESEPSEDDEDDDLDQICKTCRQPVLGSQVIQRCSRTECLSIRHKSCIEGIAKGITKGVLKKKWYCSDCRKLNRNIAFRKSLTKTTNVKS